MSRSSHPKEVQVRLEDAAKSLAPLVKAALELWLQASEDLPRHAQDADTRAATQLVQTALQQAPWRTQHCDSRQMAWLKKHLPGTSIAMHACVSNHLNTSTKRISILQALVTTTQQQQQHKTLSARLDSERSAYMLLEVLVLVVLLILPIAALCDDLPCSLKAKNSDRNTQGTSAQHNVQQAMRAMPRRTPGVKQQLEMMREVQLEMTREVDQMLGDSPLDAALDEVWQLMRDEIEESHKSVKPKSSVWKSVGFTCVERMALHTAVSPSQRSLQDMGVALGNGPPELLGRIYSAQGLIAAAGAIWVQLLSHLPPSGVYAAFMWKHLECHMTECEGFLYGPSACIYSGSIYDGAFITRAPHGGFKISHAMPKDMKPVLEYFQQRAAVASAAAARQQQHPWEVVEGTSPDIKQDQVYTVHGHGNGEPHAGEASASKAASQASSTHSSQKLAASSAQPAAAVALGDGHGDLNDMQALLRQMYGHTV